MKRLEVYETHSGYSIEENSSGSYLYYWDVYDFLQEIKGVLNKYRGQLTNETPQTSGAAEEMIEEIEKNLK